ncbi:hypothetical protein DFJ58DRAFT_845711 [Suillus subalutaceus]|uniref:uncharacterized protein n=1 Tax=Suillus subalutaceus TaxID=48586 RepID=UPI001B86ACEA|nr:uncharacterized protein DFJ58DRAFT_845711 [Suillus subalutaceus]KAG1839402.1 hypothetical protein DFJ58DRAFT_845711 [Suillus subalutaceus]
MAPERSKLCEICDQNIKPKGWTTHRKACKIHAIRKEKALSVENRNPPDLTHGPDADFDYGSTIDVTVIEPEPVDAHTFPAFARDDIKVEHHPNSSIKTTVHSFETFKCHPAPSVVPPDRQPWYPFQSRLEFKVAEIALEAALNNEQTDQLIKICQQCAIGKDKFTFFNHKDIHNKWEAASHRITKHHNLTSFKAQFTKEVISVPYDGKLWDFDVHYRDLWEFATDLLGDPSLFPHFTFDAQHLSKFDGEMFVRFVDEPFTVQDFWDIQSRLPPGGKPLAFILYADKMKLSSFGTAKGYPVVARIANLPTDIRNGRGIGSGYVVKEDKDYAEKSSWVKNTVWHTLSFPTNDVLLQDEILKEYGLRDVDNSLWAVRYTDVHRALSHDRMHNGGLWSHHLWVKLQKCVNFKHPNQVMGVTFADSSMHEDISKLILYATHDILTEQDSPLGYLLLRCIHLYLEIDIYAAFEVHTTNTINEGRSAVQAFTALMKQYIAETVDENDKGWSFPKMHMIIHIFDDIEAKGATRNYNAKPNEQMHGPLKNSYQRQTNFKDFAEQVRRTSTNLYHSLLNVYYTLY